MQGTLFYIYGMQDMNAVTNLRKLLLKTYNVVFVPVWSNPNECCNSEKDLNFVGLQYLCICNRLTVFMWWGIIYVLCFLLQKSVAFAVLSVNCLRDLLVAYSVQCQRAFICLCIVLTTDFLCAYFIAELMQLLS